MDVVPADGGVALRSAPPPALQPQRAAAGATAFFGIRIDAAANLMEAREYESLPRVERLRKALEEQRSFLNAFLDPSLQLALDLRTRVRPQVRPPIEIALLGRTWDGDPDTVRRRAGTLRDRTLAALPRHLAASPIDDLSELNQWLSPLDHQGGLDVALVTRRELVGAPRRPDAKVAYYFSVVPFNWADSDWTNLYAALSSSPVPLLLSVALTPAELPSNYKLLLEHFATFYSRLAREDRVQSGLYHGERLIPPDAFAVDAEPVFRDYARRFANRVYLMRIEVAAERELPAGLADSIAAAISPGGSTQMEHLQGERTASTYEVRRARSDYERQLGQWNLEAIDLCLFGGEPGIWSRPDPPPAELASLCVIADARDAACAFRLPIAVDGTVPGFRVRRGQFGHREAVTAQAQAVTVGYLPGTADRMAVDAASLTKHALVAGSTGSGKTTTVLELLRQLWPEHRIPFLVIEPVNSDADDYRRLLAEPGFDELQVFTVGDESARPLRFNPFEVPQGVLVAEHTANLLACFKAAFGLWEPLPSIYQDALNQTYLRAGILAAERASGEPRKWPTAIEFMQAMRKVTATLGYAGEVKYNIEAASIRRAEQLASGVSASAFLTSLHNDVGALLDHPTIIELKSLGSGDEQSLMIALLLNAITEHYQAARGASSKLEHVTVIEEAHRLLARVEGRGQEEAQAKEHAAEAFANTLAENRKYGEGLVIAEQLPTKLVADAVKNTNLKVMHRLTSEEDRRYLGETMGLDEPQMRFATRLTTGEALIYGDEFPEASQVEIRPQLQATTPPPVVPAASPPFEACAACRAQCEYRGASLAMVRDNSIVDELQSAVRALEKKGVAREQRAEDWKTLIDRLHGDVRMFEALPNDGPGLADAAYCLFLHSLAIRRMHFSPAWPPAVAQRLGLVPDSHQPVAHG